LPVAELSAQQRITAHLAKVSAEPPAQALDSRARRERLRERLKAATAPVSPSQPTPATPGEARTSALALVAELRQQLEDAQQLNGALSKDLDLARTDLSRAAEEAHSRTEEANRMAKEVAERAHLLEELGREMQSLEAERDDALIELRSARAEADKAAEARTTLEKSLADREAELSETLNEEERLAAELELKADELRRSEQGLLALRDERDALAHQVEQLTKERNDLVESQRALDEIYRALAAARSRVSTPPSQPA
jgi:chemotaxis protein MotB